GGDLEVRLLDAEHVRGVRHPDGGRRGVVVGHDRRGADAGDPGDASVVVAGYTGGRGRDLELLARPAGDRVVVRGSPDVHHVVVVVERGREDVGVGDTLRRRGVNRRRGIGVEG